MKNIIDNLGGTIMEIIIDELRENTFYAKIIIEVSALTNEIDARPSDAIALAVRSQAPIYVAESVMDTAAFLPSEESEKEGIRESTSDDPMPSTKEAKIAALQDKLREALDKEEYERAAKIRDDIKKLTSNN
jgi:bifunctional DNase/RNase